MNGQFCAIGAILCMIKLDKVFSKRTESSKKRSIKLGTQKGLQKRFANGVCMSVSVWYGHLLVA